MGRFKKLYSQGTLFVTEIWLDTETGVNYLFMQGGGLTPLLDKDGKPIITPLSEINKSRAVNNRGLRHD